MDELTSQIQKGAYGRILGLKRLLAPMTQQDVLDVIINFSLTEASKYGFAESTDFDLIYEDRSYPPKAILGMAAARVADRPLTSDEFTGGKGSACFRLLEGLGFEIKTKTSIDNTSSFETLFSLGQVVDDEADNPFIDIESVRTNTNIPETDRYQLINARIGQGLFRINVQQVERTCRVTGVSDPNFLIASHIKPWKIADNSERLDGANGLMLAPHIDRLFDKGYISFANDGSLLVSQNLPASVLKAWSITAPLIKKPLSLAQQVFMQYHRDHVFLG